jgi:hypothetical protein
MKPDKTENKIRFGCGFIFGLVLGFVYAIGWVAVTWGVFVAIVIATAIVCGLLAMKYGDSFWYYLKDRSWWLWW